MKFQPHQRRRTHAKDNETIDDNTQLHMALEYPRGRKRMVCEGAIRPAQLSKIAMNRHDGDSKSPKRIRKHRLPLDESRAADSERQNPLLARKVRGIDCGSEEIKYAVLRERTTAWSAREDDGSVCVRGRRPRRKRVVMRRATRPATQATRCSSTPWGL